MVGFGSPVDAEGSRKNSVSTSHPINTIIKVQEFHLFLAAITNKPRIRFPRYVIRLKKYHRLKEVMEYQLSRGSTTPVLTTAELNFYIQEQAAGPLMKIPFECTEWKENEKLALRMVSGSGVKSYKQVWSLERIPSGCWFTFMEEIEFPFGIFGKLIGLIG